MASLDTNILVRWLTDDDEAQVSRIETLFDDALAREERLFVPITVVLELEWVLRSRYAFSREATANSLFDLLQARELEFQFEDMLERALHSFQDATADFADCLHVALCSSYEHAPLLTFDTRAARLADAKLLQ